LPQVSGQGGCCHRWASPQKVSAHGASEHPPPGHTWRSNPGWPWSRCARQAATTARTCRACSTCSGAAAVWYLCRRSKRGLSAHVCACARAHTDPTSAQTLKRMLRENVIVQGMQHSCALHCLRERAAHWGVKSRPLPCNWPRRHYSRWVHVRDALLAGIRSKYGARPKVAECICEDAQANTRLCPAPELKRIAIWSHLVTSWWHCKSPAGRRRAPCVAKWQNGESG